MGLCLSLHTASERNIRAMLADPPLAVKWLGMDEDGMLLPPAPPRASWWDRLLGRGRATAVPSTPLPAGFELAEGEGRSTDLDKAWHGIHYLLTQTAWAGEPPLNALACGGLQVGRDGDDQGDFRVLLPDEVARLHAALVPVDRAALQARFDPARMMALDIYPGIWDRDPAQDDSFDYCACHFDELKRFVAEAAGRGLGLVIHVA